MRLGPLRLARKIGALGLPASGPLTQPLRQYRLLWPWELVEGITVLFLLGTFPYEGNGMKTISGLRVAITSRTAVIGQWLDIKD